MPAMPSDNTSNLLEVTTRAQHARNIIAGFSGVFPALADYWGQVDDALADVSALSSEIARLRDQLATCRINRANLAAAGRATVAAFLDGEPDPLIYLRDELHAQGFSAGRRQA